MTYELTRRQTLIALTALPAWLATAGMTQARRGGKARTSGFTLPEDLTEHAKLSVVLGRVTATSATISLLATEEREAFVEWGTTPGQYTHKTEVFRMEPGKAVDVNLKGLVADHGHVYRLSSRGSGAAKFVARDECAFHTQRSSGQTFRFAVQGDSHPERPFMCDPALYAKTLQLAASLKPDFYICMGDDFSISHLEEINAQAVNERYLQQRPFLGLVGMGSPVFLLNGNHEQASLFNYNQTDERHLAAVLAQKARNNYFPTIEPDGFFSGNDKPLSEIGRLKDYYAWTWGDALFVVLDNYWHSEALVDSGLHDKGNANGTDKGKGKAGRDLWNVSLGQEQYTWFKQVLESSKAKYKFVFAHHVLGTQRGGVEVSHLYEWGGHDMRGDNRFHEMRPGWEMPVHDLMAKHGVTIFFQGHDHLYCQQERDGVVYQEVPVPADPQYMTFNEERYLSGTKLPNSGHLSVTVSPEGVKVDYVRTFLPADENGERKSGQVSRSYVVKPK